MAHAMHVAVEFGGGHHRCRQVELPGVEPQRPVQLGDLLAHDTELLAGLAAQLLDPVGVDLTV